MKSSELQTRQSEGADRQRLLSLAIETYIFGFASVEIYRTMDQVAGSDRRAGSHFAFNIFFHERRPPSAADDWLAAPNTEILYSNAWLDVSAEPVMLQVPEMGNRYYVLQFIDFFANSFAHVGTRTTGNRAGSFTITGPNWQGALPAGAAEIKSPTNFVWIFGRISIGGDRELDAVHRQQDRLKLISLGAPGKQESSFEHWPPYRASCKLDFFTNLDQVLRHNGAPAQDAALIARLPQLGLTLECPFRPDFIEPPLQSILDEAIGLGHHRISERESQFEEFSPGWIWEGLSAGSYGRDHHSRAASAKAGLGILRAEEAIYPFAYVDDQGEPLDGVHSYQLTFGPGELPQAGISWSVTVYELPHYRLVKNPLNRYALGTASGQLRPDRNGFLDLILQAEQPAEGVLNWLPTPRSGSFVVAIRIFGPGEALLRGMRHLPPVARSRKKDKRTSASTECAER
jgi:hypothetical protein